MRVCVNGRPVKEYTQSGMQFIESRHGSNYSIKLKNDGGKRVMAVVSVDGLDVITGKPAEETNKGYIVDAYSTTEIKGYRLSDNDSVAFMFVSKDKSYVANAAQGDKRNSGVIGIRVFEEKPEKVKVVEKHIHHNHYPVNPWNPYPVIPAQPYWYSTTYTTTGQSSVVIDGTVIGSTTGATLNANGTVGAYNVSVSNAGLGSGQSTCASNNLSYTAGGQCMSKGLISSPVSHRSVDNSVKNDFDNAIQTDSFDTGTGWGDKQVDKVKKEYFRKGKVLTELVLYYASTDALIGMGIDLSTTPTIAESKKLPKAFGNSQYCQPPKGWVG